MASLLLSSVILYNKHGTKIRLGKQLGRDYTAFEQVNPAVLPAIDDFFSKIPSNLQLLRNLG